MTVPDDPVRCCLHVDQWPKIDNDFWHQVTAVRHVLDEEGGRSARWRTPTREKNRKAYGRWLSYLAANGYLHMDAGASVHPADRITPGRTRGYVLMLQDQVAPWTVWSYVTCLHQVARAFAPERDWSWLYRIAAKLKVRRVAIRNKLARMRSADEIVAWAYEYLESLNDKADRCPSTVLKFRDALLIAVLINCPMRLRNLAMIRIGQHLHWNGENYRLDFDPSEIKTNRYLTLHLPTNLNAYIESWIQEWRPHLIRDPDIDALWIGIRGAPMNKDNFYRRIMSMTEAAFGVAINPHLFRDIAVTTVADQIPMNIGITAPLLGHVSPKTTEEHYIHANQLSACRRYATSVGTLRQALTKKYQSTHRSAGDD